MRSGKSGNLIKSDWCEWICSKDSQLELIWCKESETQKASEVGVGVIQFIKYCPHKNVTWKYPSPYCRSDAWLCVCATGNGFISCFSRLISVICNPIWDEPNVGHDKLKIRSLIVPYGCQLVPVIKFLSFKSQLHYSYYTKCNIYAKFNGANYLISAAFVTNSLRLTPAPS